VATLAQSILSELLLQGFDAVTLHKMPQNFTLDRYIVLCPQFFRKHLPPAEKLIVYQLEQNTSGARWFTDDYFSLLNKAQSVLEFSASNVPNMQRHLNVRKVTYLPAYPDASQYFVENHRKSIDILFYGAVDGSPRRSDILNEVKNAFGNKFTIKVCTNLFGDKLYGVIRKAKLVINIHYYEGSSELEPRILEALSLGVPVLTEHGNADGYPELSSCSSVQYFDRSDMIAKISSFFSNYTGHNDARQCHNTGQRRFRYMFQRFLLKENYIERLTAGPIFPHFENYSRVLLSPSELRRNKVTTAYEFQIYDGYLHRVGWYGCSMSYHMLSIAALDRNVHHLIVAEDDAVLPDLFETKLATIISFLNSYKNWHMFCGLVADVVPSTTVIDAFMYGGFQFVVLDRMTSTVFNIYNKPALQILASYKLNRSSVVTDNYIDRYLGSRLNLRVVTIVPFIFQHDEDARSTLLSGGNNKKLYSAMINKAQLILNQKISEFHEKVGNRTWK
jgi:GR25 family glycosyltransferase involved in LPS biosynthesis